MNILYHTYKPYHLTISKNFEEYSNFARNNFALKDYEIIHSDMNKKEVLAYCDYRRTAFEQIMKDLYNNDLAFDGRKYYKNFDWQIIINKNWNVFLGMISYQFDFEDISKKPLLSILTILSAVGYLLLLIPSADLFIKITHAAFFL